MFRSAALAFRARVVGVVLTGELDDGTAGLWSVKYRGGITVVQDPLDAAHPSMPRSAADNVAIDYCLPLSEIGPLLVRLADDRFEEESAPPSEKLEIENRIALDDPQALTQNQALENILSDALRCAVEQSTIAMDLIEHARRTNDQETIGPWDAELRKAGRRMHLIQQVLNHQSE